MRNAVSNVGTISLKPFKYAVSNIPISNMEGCSVHACRWRSGAQPAQCAESPPHTTHKPHCRPNNVFSHQHTTPRHKVKRSISTRPQKVPRREPRDSSLSRPRATASSVRRLSRAQLHLELLHALLQRELLVEERTRLSRAPPLECGGVGRGVQVSEERSHGGRGRRGRRRGQRG